MTTETKRGLIAVGRRVVVAGLVLVIVWLALLALRGAISANTINLMNEQLRTISPAPPPLPLDPWSWDWARSLFSGRSVAETVGARLPTTLGLMALGGLVSLLLAGILLLIGMLVTRATERPGWLARTRTVLRVLLVSGGSSLPAFLVGAFLVVYVTIWFGAGPEGTLTRSQNLMWSIFTLSLLPAWLLVQYGLGEMARFPERPRPFDGVLWRHLGINLVTRLFKLAGALAVVTMFVEQTWLRPGLGSQMISAVNLRDFPVLFAVAWAFAVIVVAGKLLGDVAETVYKHLARPRSEQTQPEVVTRPVGIPRWLLYVSLSLVGLSLVVAAAAPLLAPYHYNEMVLGARLQAPSLQHVLGTDNLGRDILSRLFYGVRVDLLVGMLAVAVMGVVAVGWAGLAASVRRRDDWRGDTLEDMVMLPRDILCAFPWLVLILLLTAFGGIATSGPVGAILFSVHGMLLISLALLPRAAGIMQESGKSNSRGGGWLKPLLLSIPIMLVFAVAGGVLYVATVSNLGFGVIPPAPELGSMLTGPSRRYLLQAPWMGLWPAAALLLLLTSWVMTGQVLLERLGFKGKAVWSKVWE